MNLGRTMPRQGINTCCYLVMENKVRCQEKGGRNTASAWNQQQTPLASSLTLRSVKCSLRLSLDVGRI